MSKEILLNRIKKLKDLGVNITFITTDFSALSGNVSFSSGVELLPKHPKELTLSIRYGDTEECIRKKVLDIESKIEEYNNLDDNIFKYIETGLGNP